MFGMVYAEQLGCLLSRKCKCTHTPTARSRPAYAAHGEAAALLPHQGRVIAVNEPSDAVLDTPTSDAALDTQALQRFSNPYKAGDTPGSGAGADGGALKSTESKEQAHTTGWCGRAGRYTIFMLQSFGLSYHIFFL